MSKFHKAAQDGYLDLLYGATRKDMQLLDEDGKTPAHWAAEHGNLDALRTVVIRGGNVDDMDYTGATPLHLAARNGHMNCVSFLTEYNCNMWLIDNDSHSAMDVAAMNDKDEIIRYLDREAHRKTSKNPKDVQHKKEKALKKWEDNLKRYEKIQEKAMRRMEKEDRRLSKETIQNGDFKAPGSGSFLQKLSVRIKSGTFKNKDQDRPSSSRKFSDFALDQKRGGLTGKLYNKNPLMRGNSSSEFSVHEIDEHGQRSMTSLTGLPGTNKGTVNEVLYIQNDGPQRKPLYDVFPGDDSESGRLLNGTRSNSGLAITEDGFYGNGLDSTVDIQDEAPSLFNRPKMGQISFMNKMSVPQQTAQDYDSPTGTLLSEKSGENGSVGTSSSGEKRMDLPWSPDDDLGELDDDEEESEYASLELFLESCNMINYMHLFTREDINLKSLMLFDDSKLKEIGLGMGPRLVLLEAMKQRTDMIDNPPALLDTYL